ncbi:flagellar basal-body rod protein FlgF [Methylibium rhizosphaerae]|uniref:flagellar basal-body rod protein FlgF n=1 Tax=Methylibium rhizosphaerae TaxID=2570323 RepID=UPI00112A7762|nr:flagellar basal-body rod protein FlgF [Methylibium rhizosphaerae]
MLDSLFVGMTGLQGFSRGLRVISNNVTNLNTPGFKGSRQQFGDLFYQQMPGGNLPNVQGAQYGTGLGSLATTVNFQPGEVRQTGSSLDAAIDGDGFFVLRSEQGPLYTRAGQFEFNANGVLVSRTSGNPVMGFGADGTLGEVSLTGLRVNAARATTTMDLTGNLSSTATEFTVNGGKLIDSAGAEHVVRLVFRRAAQTTGGWSVEVLEGTTSLATGNVRFANGRPVVGEDSLSFTYTPTGAPSQQVTIRLGAEATSFASGTSSSLSVATQDGFAAGSLVNATFNADGVLTLSYSNGQTAQGAQLAIARFEVSGALEQSGGNEFTAADPQAARMGRPGQAGFGAVAAGQLELSNVDLSTEFSDLIVMQRGYQASSRVISTANEMLQELFDMKGR